MCCCILPTGLSVWGGGESPEGGSRGRDSQAPHLEMLRPQCRRFLAGTQLMVAIKQDWATGAGRREKVAAWRCGLSRDQAAGLSEAHLEQ